MGGAMASIHPALGAVLIAVILGLGAGRLDATSYDWPAQTTLAGDRVQLPAEFSGANVFVTVTINHRGRFRLLLDTGTSPLTLSPVAAERCGAHLVPGHPEQFSGVGGQVQVTRIALDRVEAGGLLLQGVGAFQFDARQWARMGFSELAAGDGILGIEAFHGVVLEIDYPRRAVFVTRAGAAHYPADRAIESRGSPPVVSLQVGDRALPVVVDTGYNGVLGVQTLDGLSLLSPAVREDGFGTQGLGGQTPRAEMGQLSDVAVVGPYRWHAMPVIGGGLGDRIGWGAFGQWRVVIDQPRQRIAFLDGFSAMEFPPDALSILGFYAETAGLTLRIVDVTPGGHFDQWGLRAGDVVNRVDGAAASRWAYGYEPKRVLRQPTLVFDLLRAGRPLSLVVHPAR